MPGIGDRLVHDIVELVQRIRKLDLKKTPSISETLDWARALMVLNADALDVELVNDTMSVILKHQGDIAKAQSELNALLQKKAAEKAAEKAQPAPAGRARPRLRPPEERAALRWRRRSSSSRTCCERPGVRVSVAESLDAFNAIDEMPLEDRELFKDALRATMVKRGDDIDTYDRLFDLFWSGFHDQLQSELKQALGGMPGDFDLERLLEQLRELLENMDIDLSELAKALLSMDANALEQLIQQAGEESEVGNIRNMLQIGFFSRRMIEQMDMEGAAGELKTLMDRLREEGMDEERIAELEALLKAVQEAARRAVRQFTERELDKQNHDYIERFRRESLLEKSFYNLTEEDLRRLREVVQRLAQKLKSVITMRRKRERRGKFDLKTTMRRNMAHGGVPFELVFKQRKKEKPKLVVLCDISSSVANVSRFFLQFIFSLQDCFTQGAQLRVRGRARRGQPAVPRPRHLRRDRPRPRRRRGDQSVHALELRHGLPRLLARLPVGDRQPHDRGRDRGRAQQLQRSARLVSARGALEGEERDLDQSRGARRLGLRRQRDGQVPAVHATSPRSVAT